MTLAAAVLCASLAAAPADAPGVFDYSHPHPEVVQPEQSVRVTLDDAPTSPGISLLSSSLTSLTGLVTLIGLTAGTPPGGTFDLAFRARLATSLFLLSTGPSVGDLLNHDLPGFLIGAVSRNVIAALSWGAIELMVTSGNGVTASLTLLAVSVGALVWGGWCVADLVRSVFAPQRWVERTNESLRSRRPIPEVTRFGG